MFVTSDDVEALLVGRRIMTAEVRGDAGLLSLDDGTVVKVKGNEGCGGCSSGWYAVTQVAATENVITAVRLETEPLSTDVPWDEDFIYRIFVITGNQETEAVTVEGTDGNGYYGSGYYIDILIEGDESDPCQA